MKPTLTIIGAGKVGRTLGRQFFIHAVFTPLDVLNRSLDSGLAACEFIGAGRAVTQMSDLRTADIYMLAVTDDQIQFCSQQLRQQGLIHPHTIVFHCSGALCAKDLGLSHGAASLHPIRSFADPKQVAYQFDGTICTVEGHENATQLLTAALNKIGAHTVHIEEQGKVLYHAAAVFASNYINTVLDASLNTFQAAGISFDMAKRMAEPLALESLQNVFRLGSQTALTGPISRGDVKTVQLHHDALANWDPDNAALYLVLANATQRMKDRS